MRPSAALSAQVVGSDDFGHTLTFDYVSSGGNDRLSSVTDPAGGVISYDTSANLVEVTYPDTFARNYLYRGTDSVPHLLSGIIDEADSQYSFYEYDASEDGNATSTALAGRVEQYLIYGTGIGSGSVSITEPSGASRSLTLNLVNGMSRITQTGASCAWCGSSGSFSYDANGNVSAKTDPSGSITNYGYDLARNLETSRTEAAGTAKARTTTTQWHATYRLPTLITEPKRKTAFTYDANWVSQPFVDTNLS